MSILHVLFQGPLDKHLTGDCPTVAHGWQLHLGEDFRLLTHVRLMHTASTSVWFPVVQNDIHKADEICSPSLVHLGMQTNKQKKTPLSFDLIKNDNEGKGNQINDEEE